MLNHYGRKQRPTHLVDVQGLLIGRTGGKGCSTRPNQVTDGVRKSSKKGRECAWVAQLVKHPTIDFSSGYNHTVMRLCPKLPWC